MNRSAPLDVFAYAALIAELAVRAERRAELLAERGLTEQALAEVERWYAARFEAAPEERKELERLVALQRRQSESAPDLDRTAEITGEVLAVSLPFRAATSADAERIAHRPAESSRPADGAQLDGTIETPGGVAAAPLPFAGGPASLVTPETQRPESALGADAAIVTAFPWRGGDGRLRTTVVGKFSLYLQAGAPPILVQSDPFVAFDRIAADPRFVEAASETAPWAVSASIITYGGPLRFTFHPESGEPLKLTAAAGAPVGWSMSNPERTRYAPKPPTRGPDRILTIPDGIDGRYFIAAPEAQRPKAIVGSERVVLEIGGARYDTKLPAHVIVVAVESGGQRREVILPFDTLTVHGDRRRIALIGRTTLPGEVAVVGHRLATAPPVSRPARSRALAGTAAFDAAALRAAGRAVTPFESSRSASDPNHTLPPAEEARQPAPAKSDATEPRPPAPSPKPKIAPPKPGAMAKPRFKKR